MLLLQYSTAGQCYVITTQYSWTMLIQISTARLCKYNSAQLDYVITPQYSWTILIQLSTDGLC